MQGDPTSSSEGSETVEAWGYYQGRPLGLITDDRWGRCRCLSEPIHHGLASGVMPS
jgi:hypothetical protein